MRDKLGTSLGGNSPNKRRNQYQINESDEENVPGSSPLKNQDQPIDRPYVPENMLQMQSILAKIVEQASGKYANPDLFRNLQREFQSFARKLHVSNEVLMALYIAMSRLEDESIFNMLLKAHGCFVDMEPEWH